MFDWLIKIIGSSNDREIKRISANIKNINQLEEAFKSKTEAELQDMTPYLRAKLEQGASLNDILPEAFATVREASQRVLGMRPFDVQLIGGIILHEGKIAEMKTGEGKTLVATLPVYLNALAGKGVHVVTVNDYLAKRDSEWMGRLYRYLGLTVGVIVHGLSDAQRKEAYQADITYGTNNEFGFDYLRDNMKFAFEEYVQRDFNYAIVDEVDSILVDEARTPLIISGPAEESTGKYLEANQAIVKMLSREDGETLYIKDEKANSVMLAEEGIEVLQSILGKENLYEPAEFETVHHLNQALRAHTMFKLDVDYVAKDGEIIIVDEFTGRLMPGRRYSEGLHQALEAKEGVKIQNENQTLATITFQNYFRMYDKLAGMTGTAETEALEFKKIYDLDVVVVPTNKPMVRKDNADVIYKTKDEKYKAVIKQIIACHQSGQPVLVGTSSIDDSEKVSHMLKKQGVRHHVLNAKYHEKEAEIVAQAGRKGSVTISTNMAGRGTDIMLGGNPDFMAKQRLNPEDEGFAEVQVQFKEQCKAEQAEVLELGGLFIIGTERNESRRVDNQLRGRAGRQGDPGASRFYLSLEDDLLRIFGSERIANIMDRLGVEEDEPIEHRLISRSIESAQKKVEGRNFDIRKHLLDYDDVMNKQREVIYAQRRQILSEDSLKDTVLDMAEDFVDELVSLHVSSRGTVDETELNELNQVLVSVLDLEAGLDASRNWDQAQLRPAILNLIEQRYNEREAELGLDVMHLLERQMLLITLDALWKDHLLSMDHLKEGIGLRGYGQKNPLREYQREGYDMFVSMLGRLRELSLERLFKIQVQREADVERLEKRERRQQNFIMQGAGAPEHTQPVKRDHRKVGRNESCPCGSGKKFKACCGRDA